MTVKIIDRAEDYKQAIKISCQMLEEKEIVEERYYESILSKIEEFGPYFCIAEGVAMPHARPEDGVIKEGVSVLKLNHPVDFLGKEISLFFTLAAKDNESHLDLLRKIAGVCMDGDKLKKIMSSTDELQIQEEL